MAMRMLIDAAHPEEVRVAVVKGKTLEDFDFEVAARKPLKGNIYLAKVTRVEPSLQAAFVDYGGNRHGFLAFSEIHPDYYQIPVADREALIASQMAEEAREAETEDQAVDGDGEAAPDAAGGDSHGDSHKVDEVGGDELDERPRRRAQMLRSYKIQEVIKRRQILLIQVVKEERGNKGAALTTYLSLAGRYCVLMPNTARGGGISRKITQPTDRKRLKSIVKDLDVSEGTGLIIRTAGLERTKVEIRRDFDYLLKMWEQIRELTLSSTAPALVYEEASLITRSIRDVYNREIEEILVEGEDGYKAAKSFMRMLIPSHAKRVKRFRERNPLFHRYQVEQQLDSMYTPDVTLPSGGTIVLNATEALVAIDVNSGKSTKGRNIEETALKTNLEASAEVARQLRLRDLAGLIVIDYIDMEESRNNRAVERKLKDCLRQDRARIQVGRISHFGLLEMSRQRLRPSVQEMTMEPCARCGGTGSVRSTESTALHILRAIEEEGIRGKARAVTVHMPTAAALYIFNHKRTALADIEARYGLYVELEGDDSLVSPNHRIVRAKTDATREGAAGPVQPALQQHADEDDDEVDQAETVVESRDEAEDKPTRRRRRRRKPAQAEATGEAAASEADDGAEDGAAAAEVAAEAGPDGAPTDDEAEKPKRRRRGRRGGRRRSRARQEADAANGEDETSDTAPEDTGEPPEPGPAEPEPEAESAEPEPMPVAAEPEPMPAPDDEPWSDTALAAAGGDPAQPFTNQSGESTPKAVAGDSGEVYGGEDERDGGYGGVDTATPEAALTADLVAAEAAETTPEKPKKRRTGWWRRNRAE